jgi:glycosyltransferase involved in cell wall biosynthesis
MRVAILARGMHRPGGVGRLITGLVRYLPRAAPGDEFFVLTDHPLASGLAAPNVSEVLLGGGNPAVFDHFEVPSAVRRVSPDVFLATKNSSPIGLKCPIVCVFLDLAYFALAEAYPFVDGLYMRPMFRRSAKVAARIIAISECTRDDVGRFLGRPALEKTRVVYPGVGEPFAVLPEASRADGRRRLADLPERFVLYAGNISPRKNLRRLLEALSALGDDTGLVMSGHREWKAGQMKQAIAEASRRRPVRVLGAVTDEDLALVYNLALFSVYPSLYEGFGFPVIESFACGTPVAASAATSIPEAAGDAALLFDPADTASMADAMRRLDSDERLRASLCEKGLKRAAEFGWEKTAGGILSVLKEVT